MKRGGRLTALCALVLTLELAPAAVVPVSALPAPAPAASPAAPTGTLTPTPLTSASPVAGGNLFSSSIDEAAGRVSWIDNREGPSAANPEGLSNVLRAVAGSGPTLGPETVLTPGANGYAMGLDGRRWVRQAPTDDHSAQVGDGEATATIPGLFLGNRPEPMDFTAHRIVSRAGGIWDLAKGRVPGSADAAWGTRGIRGWGGVDLIDLTTGATQTIVASEPNAPDRAVTIWGDLAAWAMPSGVRVMDLRRSTVVDYSLPATPDALAMYGKLLAAQTPGSSSSLPYVHLVDLATGRVTPWAADGGQSIAMGPHGLAVSGDRPAIYALPDQHLVPRHEGNPLGVSNFDVRGTPRRLEFVFSEPLTTCRIDVTWGVVPVRSLPCDPRWMSLGEAVADWDGRDDAGAALLQWGSYVVTVIASDADGPVVDTDGASPVVSETLWVDGVVNPSPPGSQCYGMVPNGRALNLDVTCDGVADLFAVSTAGDLWLYPGMASGPFNAGQRVASGFGGAVLITSPGAMGGETGRPLWVRTADGRLMGYFASTDTSGRVSLVFMGPIGSNWGAISAMWPAGDVNGDGYGDVYGRASNGDLWLYFGGVNGSIIGQTRVGTGWGGIDAVFGGFDVTGDGFNDVLARQPSTATLRRYPGSATGVLQGNGPVIGTGWNGLQPVTSLSAPVSGNKVLGRQLDTGKLFAYTASAPGVVTEGMQVGTGWGGIRLLW